LEGTSSAPRPRQAFCPIRPETAILLAETSSAPRPRQRQATLVPHERQAERRSRVTATRPALVHRRSQRPHS
jgi:hypothetical protein